MFGLTTRARVEYNIHIHIAYIFIQLNFNSNSKPARHLRGASGLRTAVRCVREFLHALRVPAHSGLLQSAGVQRGRRRNRAEGSHQSGQRLDVRVSYCEFRLLGSLFNSVIVVSRRFTGLERRCLNLGSYNYLGFSENSGPCCEDAKRALLEQGIAMASSRRELGTSALHLDVERLTAEFMGVEDALVFGMGFATNTMNLPALASAGCLVLSDEKNHASIIAGLRLAGVTSRVFRHNDMRHLERRLQEAVFEGQPKTGAPWRKIIIAVEGIFSMEGTIVRLPEIVALKKRYKAYVYLDEAHSVGALGKRGRGAAEYFGLDPRDIDVLMGTFSKNFAAVGGYIAGSKRLIDHLRCHSQAHCYASSMSPPVAAQILSSMQVLMGLDGSDVGATKVATLARNTKYFRRGLAQLGVITFGHADSPVVPMMVYLFSKIRWVRNVCRFSR